MTPSIEALLRQASQLHQQGRRAEAIAMYRRLLTIAPATAEAWYNLGYLLKDAGQFDQALEAYARALQHGIGQPEEVHLNRAVIYADHLRQDDAAERELHAALAVAPGFVPALLNLGNLHEERGERDEALTCYERILAQAAGSRHAGLRDEALARVAQLRPATGVDDALLTQLRTAAVVTRDDIARANLQFALGRSYDRLGLYDDAFRAFAEGNRCTRRLAPPYERTRAARLTDALIATFAEPALATGDDPAGAVPLFICGMFRSGSTLIEQALAVHSQVTAGGEIDFLPRLVAGPLAPFPASMTRADATRDIRLAREYRAHLAQVFPQAASGSYITDKRPDNFQLIGLIKRLFPSARIIHTCRNPLDTGLSVFMQHLNPQAAAYATDLGDIGHYFGQYRRLMAHWKSLYADSIFDVDYDAFVRAPEPMLQRLLAFLGLDWEPDCLEFHRLGNTVKTASYWQVRRPLYGDASGRWQHYAAHLEPLRRTLLEAGVVIEG